MMLGSLSIPGAIFILGLARSGLALAASLTKKGIPIFGWDDAEPARLRGAEIGIHITPIESVPWGEVSYCIPSPGIAHTYPTPHPFVENALRRGIPLRCDIDLFLQAYPFLEVIAVTGTLGKSTLVTLIQHGMHSAGIPAYTAGNIGIPIWSLTDIPKPGTVFVLELSSYQLELLPHLYAHTVIFLNIAPHHAERHGGIKGYIQAKAKIFQANHVHVAILGKTVEAQYQEALATLRQAGKKVEVLLDARDHHAGNLNAIRGASIHPQTVEAARHLWTFQGIAKPIQEKALATFSGLPHRHEILIQTRETCIINDSKATTPQAVAYALSTWGRSQPLYWIGGGSLEAEHDWSAVLPFLQAIKHAFLMGPAALGIVPCLSHQGVPYTLANTLRETYACAHACMGTRGGTLLFSPGAPSFNEFTSFEERGDTFRNLAFASQ